MDDVYRQILAAIQEAESKGEKSVVVTFSFPTLAQRRELRVIADQLVKIYGFKVAPIASEERIQKSAYLPPQIQYGLILRFSW